MADRVDSLPFEALVETVDDGLFVLDGDSRIIWGNAAFLDLVGLDGAERTDRTFTSFLDEGSTTTDLEAIAAGDGPTQVTVRTRSGTVVPCEVAVRALPDGRYVGRLRDLSGRRERERELGQYRRVLDAVDDTIYVTDEDRRFAWINAAVERMYGYDREAVIGSHLFEFLDEEQVDEARRNLELLVSEEPPDVITFEMETTRTDGTTFPAETRATLLPGDGFTGTVGIIRDVTDRKERERALERKNERLEAFADTISHDLRNPLNVATARVELAREECESEHLSIAGNALERMTALVDDLYALARQGRQVEERTPVDVGSLARSSWDTVATRQAELLVEGPPVVEADSTRLRQALENLFRNAADHAGPAVTVRVGALDGAAGFYVEDDGPGIPPDERARVFEAGYTTDPDGTGFGLDIVQEVVDAHDWTLSLREGADGGARFEFVTGAGG